MGIHDNDNVLHHNRPATFVPAFSRAALNGGGISSRRHTLESLADTTNIDSTSSFRYDPPGVGLKSSQQLRVDWSKFENHTFFASAEVNVNVAFDTIINTYPYDGTIKEREAFFDNLTGFEKWVYDQFPKNSGYLFFSGSSGAIAGTHITVIDHAGSTFPTLSRTQTGRSALDPAAQSMTFEMHMHVPAIANDNQVVLQKLSGTMQGFTFGLNATASTAVVDIFLAYASASTMLNVSATIDKGDFFTHVVATYDRSADVNKLFLYANQTLLATSSTSMQMGQFDFTTSPLIIGSGSTMVTVTGSFVPVESFSGALDELRIFHDVRTIDQQKENAYRDIGAQDNLRLYYKFNEPSGTFGNTTATDRIVLDSSGMSLNAYIDEVGFDYSLRVTSSLLNPMTYERIEYQPVLFPVHPEVVSLNANLLTSASLYDDVNPNLITRMVPKHYFEEGKAFDALSSIDGTIGDAYDAVDDGIPGEGKLGTAQLLSTFLYVFAKHFDELKLFVDAFGKSLFVNYDEHDVSPDQLLSFVSSYYGFELPGLFTHSNIAQFVSGDDLKRDYSTSQTTLKSVQNELWRRILSNLTEIVRSKGTMHSIKAFIRTIGIDPDQNFRIREYGGSQRSRLGEARENKAVVSKMIDMSGSLSQIVSPHLFGTRVEPGWPTRANTSHDGLFTSGSWTYEAFYRFPLSRQNVTTQSLCRMCVSGSALAGAAITFNLVAVSSSVPTSASVILYGKPATGSTANHMRLVLTGTNVYDGEQWYLSYGRNRNDDPTADLDSTTSSSYFLRAYRQTCGQLIESHVTSSWVHETTDNNHLANSLQATSSYNASGSFFMIGDQSPDVTLEYLTSSDEVVTTFAGRIGHMRFWSRGLTQAETREHALNFRSLGVETPTTNFNFVTNASGSFERIRIDASSAQPVTASDAAGALQIFDFSQNGLHLSGINFLATASVIQPEQFRYSILSPRIDQPASNDKVRIRSFQHYENVVHYGGDLGEVYETPPSERVLDDPRFAIDFSIVDSLNEDIVNIFATFEELDSAIGNPELIFAEDYPSLENMRTIYFNRLTTKINLKSFFEFFKWFDSSVGMFIEQLVPRKTKFLGTNFIIESHMLERPKFAYQFEEMYLGELNRHGLRDTMLLQLIRGNITRY